MSEKFIEFIYDKALKRPKRLQNNVFVLYLSDRIKAKPGEYKKNDMKLSIRPPEQIITVSTLLSSFSKKISS